MIPILEQIEAEVEHLDDEAKGLGTMAGDISSTKQGIQDLETTVQTEDDRADTLKTEINKLGDEIDT